MLLQPIVENCLKHGLAPKIGGGKIELRTIDRDGRLSIEIEDNGVGISGERLPPVYVGGIGLSNVRERLRVLYGTDFQLDIPSRLSEDRKSTRLNSSHGYISYAVFCLKKKQTLGNYGPI